VALSLFDTHTPVFVRVTQGAVTGSPTSLLPATVTTERWLNDDMIFNCIDRVVGNALTQCQLSNWSRRRISTERNWALLTFLLECCSFCADATIHDSVEKKRFSPQHFARIPLTILETNLWRAQLSYLGSSLYFYLVQSVLLTTRLWVEYDTLSRCGCENEESVVRGLIVVTCFISKRYISTALVDISCDSAWKSLPAAKTIYRSSNKDEWSRDGTITKLKQSSTPQ
jgi:hypothetical protein